MARCPQCGTETNSNDFAGLCPKCLIAGAFSSSAGDGSSGMPEGGIEGIDLPPEMGGEDDFGRYQIIRLLGEGGMGTVYLAEQREPIRRSVALKVIKPGMDTTQVLARFANERQTLAMMDHPNIARIFDAGATQKGRPYFVMEYIEGTPITEYCDDRRMTVSNRLELFLAVCRAVQHAHQKGVIHRDLKPSNVMVAEQESRPVPKVIDFGIAKATDQWALESTLLTQFGQMVGTPEYASPEQTEVTTGEVDESSDVYSMGVLLYELLVGAVPFEATRLRQAARAEMLRIVREEEAPPLSRKLSTMGAAAAEIANLRQTDTASLRRLVSGDLNSIAMKALEKARVRRYVSAGALAADIQRYMEQRPVLASRPNAAYRTRKFLRRNRPAVLAAAAGLTFALLSGMTVWSFEHRGSPPRPTVTDRRTIVLGDFANNSGDAAFDGTLRQSMAAELGRSPYLSLLSDARVRDTLRLMVRGPDAKVMPDIALEICERTGSAAVVEGWIARLGNRHVLGLRARNCRTGDILDEEQASAERKEDVFNALGQIANRFLMWAAQYLPNEKRQPSLRVEVTTPSLEAWRSYSAAMKAAESTSVAAEPLSLLNRAVEIDPKFAMAYAFLGRYHDGLGESETGAKNIAKAYELRDGVSDWENYFITVNYHRQVTRNLERARQALESWIQKYPRDLEPHALLSGFTSLGAGRYEKAVEEGQKALELDPDFSIAYTNMAWAYVYLNRLTEAEATLREASERKIDSIHYSLCRYAIAFLRNDKAAMEREAAQRRAKSEAQGSFEHQEALTLASEGRLKEAMSLSTRAVNLARQGGLRERAAQFEGARAAWSALFGFRVDAENSAKTALALARSRDADYGPAFALAFLKESAQAHAIEAELATRYPEDTSVQFSYLPALRALDALNRDDAQKALEMTQAAAPYELAVPGAAYYSGAFFGTLYPAYVRGVAYTRLGRHREAAAEFQKILDYPGLVINDPIGSLTRLQLARALSASGERARSVAVYQDLLALWENADADIPVVRQARAEAAR